MSVAFLVGGIVLILIGGLNLFKPDVGITLRNLWTKALTRPFLHGRVLGGEARTDDPLQRVAMRAIGVLFVVIGIAFAVQGVIGQQ